MNIFVLPFFIAFLACHTLAFSQAQKESPPDEEQTGALLDLCLSEITTRRIILKDEIKELSTKIHEEDNTNLVSVILTSYLNTTILFIKPL